ncbi:MAG: hypothetical protein ACHQEB_04660 [Chitinophagales bacterium]
MKFLSHGFLISYIITGLLSCRSIKEPIYKGIDNLQLKSLALNQSTLSLNMNYFNPNKSGIKLKEAEGDAWMDSTYLGHFHMDTLIQIYGNTAFSIPVKLDVDMKNAVKNVLNAIFSPEIVLKIDGKAKIGKAGVFVRYPIRYEGKQNIAEMIK